MSYEIEDAIIITLRIGAFNDGTYRLLVDNGNGNMAALFISYDKNAVEEVARRINYTVEEFADRDHLYEL
jgi:hypothetical protein